MLSLTGYKAGFVPYGLGCAHLVILPCAGSRMSVSNQIAKYI